MLDTANDILRTANDIVGQIAGLVGQLKSSVAPAATDAAGEAAKTPSMASRAADIADNVGTLVKSVGALVDSLNRLQPDLQQTLATTRTLAGNTNDLVVRTLGIEESLRRDTLGRLNHTLEAADGMVRQSAPPLQQSLGDFRYMMGASSASIVRLVAQMDTITANLAEITRQLRDDPAALLHGRSLENPPGLAGRPR
jgi:DNA anti-recombination protein RmuC